MKCKGTMLMDNMLAKLNERQLEAVTLPVNKSSLILASAGSGKTQLMIMRIVYLINQGVDPSNIMSVTFTNKASKEMRERLNTYLPVHQSAKVTMGTFHKICIIMLKRFGESIGLDPAFAIADSADQQKIMKDVLLTNGEGASTQDVREAISTISNIKNKMYSPTDLLGIISDGSNKSYTTTTYNIYNDYQDGLAKINMLDFDDILLNAVKLLRLCKDTRTYYQKRYSHITVDEMQDVNPVQYELVLLLTGRKQPTQPAINILLAVGDDFQTIYSFRGSSLQIIMNFENDFPQAHVIKLEQNYRSTKAIVHTANGLIKHNIFQKEKTSFTTNSNGDPVTVYKADDGEEEAIFIAEEIKNLATFNGYEYNEIAILYRTNVLSRALEHAFINAQIPYEIVGSTSFFGRMEIKDTIAYLRLVANPLDDIALERVMNTTPGLGKTTIETIKENAVLKGQPLAKAMKEFKAARKPARDAIESLRHTLKTLYGFNKSELKKYTVEEMIQSVWDMTGYRSHYDKKPTDENKARLENLDELLSIATLYDTTTEDPSLSDFLESSVLHPADEVEEVPNAVQLMTIHASKGLQYKAVFVIGMNEQLLPHQNSFAEADGIEEERRLAYVAITRAEQRLYLTYATSRYMYGRRQAMSVSRFIQELPSESILESTSSAIGSW